MAKFTLIFVWHSIVYSVAFFNPILLFVALNSLYSCFCIVPYIFSSFLSNFLWLDAKCYVCYLVDWEYFWVQTSPDGWQNEIKGATTASYILSCSDIRFLLSVLCEPARCDRASGLFCFLNMFVPLLLVCWPHSSFHYSSVCIILFSKEYNTNQSCLIHYAGTTRGSIWQPRIFKLEH